MKRLLLTFAILSLLFAGNFSTQPGSAQSSDPGAPGPLAVIRAEYNFGDTAFTPTNFPAPVELRASVHHPADLSGGPFPFIVFLHGRHATCFDANGNVALEWPCSAGRSTIPSFQGYDYSAEQLASHGFIVISISANGVNAQDNAVADLGALARAELIQKHLEIWMTFNTTGGAPFSTQFVGKVNLNNVGTMGHSRGGEGVIRHFQLNQSQGSPFGVKAVFPLAPVDFNRGVINNVNLLVMLPYCDGDVLDLQGAHFYDDARYNAPGDTRPKHSVLIMGGNHNFYNTVWTPGEFPAGASDDWAVLSSVLVTAANDPQCGLSSSNRLTPAQQRGTGKAFFAAFFRAYLKGESQFLSILTSAAPPPPSATTNEIHVAYHAPDNPQKRRDVNRLLNAGNLTTNTLGGAVTQNGLDPYDLCGGEAPQPRFCLQRSPILFVNLGITPNEPHAAPSFNAPDKRGLSQLRIAWVNVISTAQYQNDLPAGSRNVSGFEAVQFRVSVNFEDPRNTSGQPQDLSVILTDGLGRASTVRAGSQSRALFFPPGANASVVVPRVMQNSVRIPLSSFGGVNLGDIRSIRFRFDQRGSGALLISDLAFASRP